MRELKNVTLEITTKCNFKCKHCCNDSSKINQDNLTKEEICKLITDLSAMGVERLGITGGEPLCDEFIFYYLDYIKDKIPTVTLSTNGYLMNEEIAQKLIQYNVMKFSVSIDGNKDYHDSFRGMPNAYDRALNAIKILSDNNALIKVKSVLTKYNQDSILDLMDVTNDLKITRHEIFPVCPIGRADKDLILSDIEYKKFILRALEKIRQIDPKITFQLKPVYSQEDLFIDIDERCREKSLNYRCDALDTSLQICANGDIIPCSFIRIPLGNVRHDLIEEMWNKKETLMYYQKIFSHHQKGECGSCESNQKCNGGCYANKLYGNGEDQKDPYCFAYTKRR